MEMNLFLTATKRASQNIKTMNIMNFTTTFSRLLMRLGGFQVSNFPGNKKRRAAEEEAGILNFSAKKEIDASGDH